MRYLFNGISLQNGRQSNMDSLLMKCGNVGGRKVLLAVVCDGVGSLEHGAFASGTAVKMLNEWFGKITNADRIGLKMRDAILKINFHIMSEARHRDMKAASTLSSIFLVDETYYIVHIGDSRIYSYEDKRLSILTKDDVSESGKLTACIGQTEDIILQYYEGNGADKIFLLCTDGLYKRMDSNFLISKMKVENKRAFKESADALMRYVIERGEKDNISFALVKIKR